MIANERFTVTPALTQDTRTVAINGFICCWSGVRMQQYVFYGNKCHANNTEIGGATFGYTGYWKGILWVHIVTKTISQINSFFSTWM